MSAEFDISASPFVKGYSEKEVGLAITRIRVFSCPWASRKFKTDHFYFIILRLLR